jgi:hypothetical protein
MSRFFRGLMSCFVMLVIIPTALSLPNFDVFCVKFKSNIFVDYFFLYKNKFISFLVKDCS